MFENDLTLNFTLTKLRFRLRRMLIIIFYVDFFLNGYRRSINPHTPKLTIMDVIMLPRCMFVRNDDAKNYIKKFYSDPIFLGLSN